MAAAAAEDCDISLVKKKPLTLASQTSKTYISIFEFCD